MMTLSQTSHRKLASEFPVDLPTIDDSEEWTPSEYFQKVEEYRRTIKMVLDVNSIQLDFSSQNI